MTVIAFILSGWEAILFIAILYLLIAGPVLALIVWLLNKARDLVVQRIQADAERRRVEILQDE